MPQTLHFPTFALIMRTLLTSAFTRHLAADPTNTQLYLFHRLWTTHKLEAWFTAAMATAWRASPETACASLPELVTDDTPSEYPYAIKMVGPTSVGVDDG